MALWWRSVTIVEAVTMLPFRATRLGFLVVRGIHLSAYHGCEPVQNASRPQHAFDFACFCLFSKGIIERSCAANSPLEVEHEALPRPGEGLLHREVAFVALSLRRTLQVRVRYSVGRSNKREKKKLRAAA